MANIILLVCAILSNVLLIMSDTPPFTVKSKLHQVTECQTNLDSCTFKLDKPFLVSPSGIGPKGDKGDTGEKGENGLPGQMGLKGDTGYPGPVGISGLKGTKGLRGMPGDKGEQGLQGIQGPPGPKGKTVKGERGAPGITGPPGPPGRPGMMGSCPCTYPVEPNFDVDGVKVEFGTYDYPAEEVCKDASAKITIDKNTTLYIGPGRIKVECVREGESILTCIPRVLGSPFSIEKASYDKHPFWLSSKGLTVESIYGITRGQIAWIQERSNSVHQTIRFHCVNSVPYLKDNTSNSLMMLSWNDAIFGPLPSYHLEHTVRYPTPFVYTVLPEANDCYNAKKGEKAHSDIKLESNLAQRLPVVDFMIRDITDGAQSVGIEHVRLCFN